jgi:hypothetical protein
MYSSPDFIMVNKYKKILRQGKGSVQGRRELHTECWWGNLKIKLSDQLDGQAALPLGKYAPAPTGSWVGARSTLNILEKT